jgi:hypothetical protein
VAACTAPAFRAAANFQEVQQVQHRIAATLQSVFTTQALPAVLAGTIAFPGCVHIMCTFASQLPDIELAQEPSQQQKQKQKPDNEGAWLFHKEGLLQQLEAAMPGSCVVAAVQHLPGAVAAAEAADEAPAAAMALQPAALAVVEIDSNSGGLTLEPHHLCLAFAAGLAGQLQQQGYNQLRVVVGREQQPQQQQKQQLLFDQCWELAALLQSAVIEFELDVAKLAAAMPRQQQQQQQQQLGCLSIAVLASKELLSSVTASNAGGPSLHAENSPTRSQSQHVQPGELVLGLLPLPLLPPAAAKELQQLQDLAEAKDTGPVHVYTSVLLPVLQDLQCAILLCGSVAGNGSSSGSSSRGSEDGCVNAVVFEVGQPSGVGVHLAMDALAAFFERHKMASCSQIIQSLRGSSSSSSNDTLQQQQQQRRQAELAAAAERLLGKSRLTAWGNCIWGALFGWRERQFETAYGAAAVEAQQSVRWVQAVLLCALDVAACLVAGVYAVVLLLQHAAEAAVVVHAAWALAAACACMWGIAAGMYVQRSVAAFYSSGKAASLMALLRLTMQLVHCWMSSADGLRLGSFNSLRDVRSGAELAGVAAIAPAVAAAAQFGSWAVCLVIVAARVVLHRLLPLWLLLHAALEAALVLFGLWRLEWILEWEMLGSSAAWSQVLLAAVRGVVIVVAVEAHSRVRYLHAMQRRADDGGVSTLASGQVTYNERLSYT